MKNWAIYIVVALGFVTYEAMTEADRDESGAIVGGGTVDAFQIRVGDCFDDSDAMDDISDLPGVPCSDPHDNEAYSVFDVTIASYPEADGMGDLAYEKCMQHFASFVGTDYESSSLEVFTMFPSAASWNQQHDREVVCAVYDMNAEKLVGSVEGRGL